MPVQVTFSIDKSDSLTPLVVLKKFPTGPETDMHFANDEDEVRTLETKVTYVVTWDVIGKKKDKIKVTWKADDGREGVLIDDFKIDPNHVDARPWPGEDMWFDHGINGLRL